jgi:hypothetical protein
MQLTYTSPQETTIQVTLAKGESLGDLIGPTVAHVPTDPMNRHYAAIIQGQHKIEPYEGKPDDATKTTQSHTVTRTTTRTR